MYPYCTEFDLAIKQFVIYICRQNVNDDVNETATAAQQSQAAAIIADSATAERDGAVTKRQHFPMNINRAGYIVFSVSLQKIYKYTHLIAVF